MTKLKFIIIDIKYAFKTLTKPINAKFEYYGKSVNRFVYLRETLKLINKIRKETIK